MSLSRKQLQRLERELVDPISYMSPPEFIAESQRIRRIAWIVIGVAGLVLVVMVNNRLASLLAFGAASTLFFLGLYLLLTVRQWIARERRHHLMQRHPQLKNLAHHKRQR